METARNNEICQLYRETDLTQTAIAERYGITKMRVCQILRKGGMTRTPKQRSMRTAFTGIHLSIPVKAAARALAKSDGKKSLSEWIAAIVEQELKSRGIDVVKEDRERAEFLRRNTPLPLEG